MNKEYWDYYFSKKKKLTDRAFKIRIAMLMISMLACAAIMASSAFAFFTSDISTTTDLRAATFEVSGLQTAASGDTRTYELYGTPGVAGYCVITVWDKYGAPTIYYTKSFIGSMNITITAAEGSGISIKPHWGDPRNFGITANLIGNGGVIEHSRTPEPEPESETSGGGGGEDVLQEKNDSQTDNTPTVDETEENNEVIKTPMPSVSPSVNKEQITVTESMTIEKAPTSVIEKTETTVTQTTPSVSETPVQSVQPSDNSASDSGTAPSTPESSDNIPAASAGEGSSESASSSDTSGDSSSGTSATVSSTASSGDSGSSSGSVSSGSDASTGGTPHSSSDDGGE